jgi:UPF0176 protein
MTTKNTNQDGQLVASFYQFIDWQDYKTLKLELENLCEKKNILGTILLAPEGINGTISGEKESIESVINVLKKDSRMKNLEPKYSIAYGKTFYRMRVKLKKEIVSMGKDLTKPAKKTGTKIQARDWNQVLLDPDIIVIDTRNDYEISIGTFEGAIDPKTKSFREFPKWIETELKPLIDKKNEKKVAMFCTGGIRCEKASSYLLDSGFDEVLQLNGGILKYLEEINTDKSLWKGECFLFDERVSVQHGLLEGNYSMCHACRMPIDNNDKKSNHYIEGISCPNCFETHSEERKKRFAERQKQISLAKKRNEPHIGKKY